MEKQCMYMHWVYGKMGKKEEDSQRASFLGLSLEAVILLASCLSSQIACACTCAYVLCKQEHGRQFAPLFFHLTVYLGDTSILAHISLLNDFK